MSALRSGQADRVFDRLYRRHVGDVYRYALAVTGNAADAEDVAQVTFMNAYRALERGERPSKAQNWLIAIAHNVCRQRFRQASRRPTEVGFDEDLAAGLVPNEDAPTATDIQRALGHLPLTQRSALVMRELEGRSYAEIAAVLELTVSAVETLLFRARRALREQLDGGLTCSEAEAALSRQQDGLLPRFESGAVRAHLRECEECRRIARSQRAQRGGWKALAVAPVPGSLGSWFGGGAAGLGGAAVAAKVAAVTVAAVVVGGGGYAVVKHETAPTRHVAAPALASHARVKAHAKVAHVTRPVAKLPVRHAGVVSTPASSRAASPHSTRTPPAKSASRGSTPVTKAPVRTHPAKPASSPHAVTQTPARPSCASASAPAHGKVVAAPVTTKPCTATKAAVGKAHSAQP